MRPYLSLAALLLAACAGEPPCDAVITGFHPDDEGGPVARRAAIQLELQGHGEPTFQVRVDGSTVAGRVQESASGARFEPDQPYPAHAEVTWTAEVCDDGAQGSFFTGELEEPVPPSELQHSSYAIDLSEATWVQPEGAGDQVGDLFGGVLLLGIEAATHTEIECLGAAGEATATGSWQQDPCFATIDFPPADFRNNPYFALTAPLMQNRVQGNDVRLHDVHLSGGLTLDGLFEGRFEGEVDLREYDFGDSDGCTLLAFFGVSCVPCVYDGSGAVQCVMLEAVDVTGERVDGLQVFPNEDPQECD